MQITAGDYVMYYGAGICKVEGLTKKSFDGAGEQDYYCLKPYNCANSTYFVPADSLSAKVRKPLEKEEILEIIDNIPNIEPQWNSDNNERKSLFGNIMKSDDYEQIFCMLKSIYQERRNRISNGKKLSFTDEKTMKSAENIVCQEFAFVLGIKPEEVMDFITDRIESNE